jgi:uncharacterized protein (DUF2147 family)
MRTFLAFTALALLSAGAIAQEATSEGNWRDDFGTILSISFCGDGTQLCGVLVDVQGESRTEENLAFVNQQVLQADPTTPNEWQGSVIFGGNEATATITQVAPDTIEIQGCRVVVLCETLAFHRMGGG